MSDPVVLVERGFRDGVTKVVFNRPEKRNAMSPALHEAMAETLEELRYDDETRVVVLTGSGGSFSAGQDVKETFALKSEPAKFDRIARIATEWRSRTIRFFPKPVISMVNGYCFGGALSIVEASDVSVAAHEATFSIAEINIGIIPGGTVSKTMAVGMTSQAAMMYGLSGRRFDGKEAERIGLVAYSVPMDELEQSVGDLAEEIASKDPMALRGTKEAFRVSVNSDWESSILYMAARTKALKLEQNAGT